MKTEVLRSTFLDYFESQGHVVVPSSGLIPAEDDGTLLFANAGMVQFKRLFLGLDRVPYPCATSSQRCLRAGGKHNDLENVGYTARHHTFFEMLGNFSFGNYASLATQTKSFSERPYFKVEAIRHAWSFLTIILKIPAERLWVTVFEEDREAENIWLTELGVDPSRFSRCGATDNFWSMGDTGPCGPCTEIFYDHGPAIAGGPPGSADADGDRYVEVWNLVFMQYNRRTDGQLDPLPKPSVDTGMGLERIAAVMQGVHSNYEIDLFQRLIQALLNLGVVGDAPQHSLRAIVDHIRACAFLVAEGIVPSNEGRGYVLRRIARRAIRHGQAVGFQEPFFHRLVKPLVEEMADAHPILKTRAAHIEAVLYQEELQFQKTLDQGLKILKQDLADCVDQTLSGQSVFKLYDTYGFPVDLTADIARECHIGLDMAGFDALMQQQKNRSRDNGNFRVSYQEVIDLPEGVESVTGFVGYEDLNSEATILALYPEHTTETMSILEAPAKGRVILDQTPFYAESGGQVGDQGVLKTNTGVFEVENTSKVGSLFVHHGLMKQGFLKLSEKISAAVDAKKRLSTALNHSATHLLHAVLRQLLGEQVNQKGSLVRPDRLRFDFSYARALTAAELRSVERLVNQKILENSLVQTEILPLEEARARGAIALFSEKYGSKVRLLSMGNTFSVELCGGTHVQRTGDIGQFKILTESGIAAGVRRIEAITGEAVLDYYQHLDEQLNVVSEALKCTPDRLIERAQQLSLKNRQLEKELQQLQAKGLAQGFDFESHIRVIQGKRVLAVKVPMGDLKTLRATAERFRDQWGLSVAVLGGVDASDAQKVQLLVVVAKDCIQQWPAPLILKPLAAQLGGHGGGRPDLAQGGGHLVSDLDAALNSVYDFLEQASIV